MVFLHSLSMLTLEFSSNAYIFMKELWDEGSTLKYVWKMPYIKQENKFNSRRNWCGLESKICGKNLPNTIEWRIHLICLTNYLGGFWMQDKNNFVDFILQLGYAFDLYIILIFDLQLCGDSINSMLEIWPFSEDG